MESAVVTLIIGVGSLLVATLGFLATQYWNLKKSHASITQRLEVKVNTLQTKSIEHESKFDLVLQKIDTTENAIEKLESTVAANLSKMEDKLDRILEHLLDVRSS